MRRAARILGTLLVVAGVATLAWAVTVWQWQDPFTAVYTKWQQGRLGSQLDARMRTWQPPRPILRPVVMQAAPAQKAPSVRIVTTAPASPAPASPAPADAAL